MHTRIPTLIITLQCCGFITAGRGTTRGFGDEACACVYVEEWVMTSLRSVEKGGQCFKETLRPRKEIRT